jgi:hypothetical protein
VVLWAGTWGGLQFCQHLSPQDLGGQVTHSHTPVARLLDMTSSISDKLSNSLTWAEMTPLGASMACLDTSAATDENEDSEFRRTMKAILCPLRLAALEAADVAPVAYNNYSFFSKITTIRGRNFPMLVAPLVSLFFWGLCWQLLFWYGPKDESAYIDVTDVQEYFISIESLIDPLLTPLSFLLVFRLGRAAVRFWDVSVFYAMNAAHIVFCVISTTRCEYTFFIAQSLVKQLERWLRFVALWLLPLFLNSCRPLD